MSKYTPSLVHTYTLNNKWKSIYSVERPKRRIDKLDDFVMTHKIITVDDLHAISIIKAFNQSLSYCSKRTGKKFIKRDIYSWKIK